MSDLMDDLTVSIVNAKALRFVVEKAFDNLDNEDKKQITLTLMDQVIELLQSHQNIFDAQVEFIQTINSLLGQ